MKRNKGLKVSDQRKLEARIKVFIGKDFSDEEIMEALGLQPHVLRHYRKRIVEAEMAWLKSRSVENVFAEYVRQSEQWVTDLERLCKLFRKQGQSTALVQAIRQKRRIHSQVIKMGQELGIIPTGVTTFQADGVTFRKIGNAEQRDELSST